MTAVRDTLISARERIARGHCKNAFARNERGHEVDVHSSAAASYCAVGALWATSAKGFDDGIVDDARFTLCKALGVNALSVWNDAPERTQADVLAAFDRAIAGCV